MILIKNANLYSMAEVNNQICDILVEGTKIAKVGTLSESDYPNARVIDAQEKMVTPGLIEAHCHVGVSQQAGLNFGNDTNEMTDPIVPEMRGYDAVKPQDEAFPLALDAGITTVATGPGSGEIFAGTFCILKTHGKTIEDMCIVEDSFMKIALGENPKRLFGTKGKMPVTRMAIAAMLRENLTKAKKYDEKMKKYNADVQAGKEDAKEPEYNAKLAALSKVFNGLPVKMHAHQQNDIVTAIQIMKEFGLKGTIEHASESHLITDYIKDNDIKVIIGPTLVGKVKLEVFNKTFETAKILEENGIEFAVMTDHPVVPLEHARTQAAIYINHGASYMTILKALTINAAKLCGIDNRVGSIEVGKDADIVIWSDDLFNYTAKTETIILNGEVLKG